MTTPSQLLIDLLGTNQSTQDRKIQPGEFVELINMRREKAGELVKRNGHTMRSISDFDNPVYMEYVSDNGGGFGYDSGPETWAPSAPPATLVVTFNEDVDLDSLTEGLVISERTASSGDPFVPITGPHAYGTYDVSVVGSAVHITPSIAWITLAEQLDMHFTFGTLVEGLSGNRLLEPVVVDVTIIDVGS
jgi:hypothetical protein